MNTLRTFIVFAILSAVGYGVYATLTHQPPPPPPEVAGQEWGDAPQVELPGSPSGMPPAGISGIGSAPAGVSAETALNFGGGAPPAAAPGAPVPLEAAPLQPAPTAGAYDPYAAAQPPATADAAPPYDPNAAAPAAGSLPPDRYGDLGAAGAAQIPGAAMPSPDAGQSLPHDPLDPAAAPLAGDPNAPPGVAPLGSDPTAAVDPNAPASRYPAAPGYPDAQSTPQPQTQVPTDPMAVPYQDPATGAAAAAAPASFEALMAQVQTQLDQGRLADAHLELSRWYRAPQLTQAQHEQVHDLLNRLAGTVVYSQESLLEPPYEVQPGDNLERVAKLYDVPWQLLAKINGIANPQALQPGQSLKVIRGPFHATVELESFTLTVWLGERYAGSFPIGIGQDQATPEGTFQVLGKLENPPYHGRDAVLAADDPNNPLGERWIDLGNHIGIHGTTDASSVGRAESRGCIRLTERDVEDVYDILGVGSSVVIRR